MEKQEPLTSDEGEVRELRADDFRLFRPASEVLPTDLRAKLATRSRGPQRSPTKERISIRLSREVVAYFRSTGVGWQNRVDAALIDWLRQQSAG